MTTLTVRLFGKLSVSCEGRELAGLDACKAQVPPLETWGFDHPAACIRVPEIHAP